MHFGRFAPEIERAEELALIKFLRTNEKRIEHLYLLGDVFDQYIEYPNLVPKGFTRFQALLAEWTDRGCPVTYLTGNHDPWHIDYFREELGVRVSFKPITEPLYGKNFYLQHGDGIASRFPFNAWIKRVLQHPVPVGLYRTLLPGDIGYRLARWVNRRIHTDVISKEVVAALRNHARYLLGKERHDIVLMGHSHMPEHAEWPEGTYINTGSWRLSRTFACFSTDGIRLMKWDEVALAAHALPIASDIAPEKHRGEDRLTETSG